MFQTIGLMTILRTGLSGGIPDQVRDVGKRAGIEGLNQTSLYLLKTNTNSLPGALEPNSPALGSGFIVST